MIMVNAKSFLLFVSLCWLLRLVAIAYQPACALLCFCSELREHFRSLVMSAETGDEDAQKDCYGFGTSLFLRSKI